MNNQEKDKIHPAAAPSADAVLQLLNHIEDVVDDANFEKIDHKLWNAVTMAWMAGAAAKTEQVDCVACEGKPSGMNNPCAVCGRAAGAGSEQPGACDACKGRGELFIAGVMGRCGLCKGAALARAPLPEQDGDARDAPGLEELMIEHRIAVTPEYEGGFHAQVYKNREEPLANGYGPTPRAAIDAAMSASRPDDKGGAHADQA